MKRKESTTPRIPPVHPPKTKPDLPALREAREEIDRIDEQMRALFLRRMEIVRGIAAQKAELRLPIYDAEREFRILRAAAKACGDDGLRPYYLSFQKSTLALSRAYQNALSAIRDGAGGVRLDVALADASYPILFGRGLLARADRIFALSRRVMIVTDDGVPPRYAQTLLSLVNGRADPVCRAFLYTMPAGEANKTFSQYEKLLGAMREAEISRSDCVIAVGGGVVSDLAGFAAATYMRGIDFYTVPTTLLAMADASVGGKCAVDLNGAKNVIGAFHQPKAILIDPNLLQTLPERQMHAGFSEIVKIAVVRDAGLLEALEREGLTDEAILAAVRLKKEIVEADEKESGERKLLNFGHTLGHAMESAANGALLHGEAVALGMLPMCEAPLRARLLALYRAHGLPTETTLTPEQIGAFLSADKKRIGDRFAAILTAEAGAGKIRSLTREQILQRLKESGICL